MTISSVRLDRVFREIKELVPIDGLELLTPSTVHGVVPQSSLDSKPQQAFREGYRVAPAQPNDFVISLSSHAHGIEWCGLTGGISPDYTLLRPIVDTQYVRYLKYALKSQYVISQLGVFKTGVRMGLRLQWNKVRYCTIDLPPLPTAVELSDHLDRATSRIDTLLAKKTRFIELLREKRQALITHAVTKGLDPNVPMKDSGVEWLGKVPAHWNVFRFKQSTFSCQNGLWGADPNGVDDIECVRVADFNRPTLKVNPDIPTLRAVTEKERSGRLLKRGNLLLEKSGGGENQPVGQVVLYDRDASAICSNFVAKIELAPGMDQRFWNYQHHAAYTARVNVKSIKQTSGIQNLDHHQYLDELAVFPSANEQTGIADHLDRATTRIDTLIAKTECSIELLREHRTALITAAVTGKLDLRPAA
ncbi:restriction endonuclease subunit S [Lysobacter sp. H23M47]|uniref:restriction endonuclease subunit S n=1 Tax=Lysobacter sp. H23M47 TaxID=2781024 RepID=UPI00187E6EBC|nr:restriction endonuclease subunit S [Lysobacter sp. H23M47]QOW24695.1 restriction endonuclease subunit S [Lysobacter sp. H23M47]